MLFFQVAWMYITFVLFACSIYVTAYAFYKLIKLAKMRARRNRIREMMRRLANPGIRFHVKSAGDVLGLCTTKAVDEAFAEYEENLRKGKVHDWDRVVLFPKPMFTFAKDIGSHRPVHTGLWSDLDSLKIELIEKITGLSTEGLNEKEISMIADEVLIRDSRLFVPYANDVAKAEVQNKYYGMPTMAMAREAVLNS